MKRERELQNQSHDAEFSILPGNHSWGQPCDNEEKFLRLRLRLSLTYFLTNNTFHGTRMKIKIHKNQKTMKVFLRKRTLRKKNIYIHISRIKTEISQVERKEGRKVDSQSK